MRLRVAAISGTCASLLLLIGCAAPLNNTLPNMPVFNTGASAVIIAPGQAAPPMTGYYPPGAAQGAPGVVPQGAAGGGPAGAPQGGLVPVPTGSGPDITMLGGATTIDTRQMRTTGRDPMWDYPLLWPVAALVWPFEKLNQALTTSTQSSNGNYAQNGYPGAAPPPGLTAPMASPIPPKQRIEAAHEQAQVDEMKRQLASRQSGGGEPQAASAGHPSLSIADELAALRNREATAPSGPPPTQLGGPTAEGSAAGAADWTTIKTEDRDHDGRPDRWVQESRGRKRELLDDDHDGRPEKTIYYEPGSDKIARVEEDTNGDGQPDAWTLYKDGQVVVRRADTNGDGEVDSWTFYRDGQVVRQEQDTDGDGVRDRVDYYENGKLVRRTEDKDGDGHPERITLFDAKGNPVELDEDKNSDGKIDVRSYYTGGKLTRRELLDDSQAVQ